MDYKGADTDRNRVYIWIVQPSLQLTLSIKQTRVIQNTYRDNGYHVAI